jgi:large subunit ribosomal protein L5
VPVLSKITISSLVPNAGENRDYLYVANMALRAITGVRSSIFLAKRSLAAGHRTTHTQKAGNPIAVGSSLDGETMWHFLSTLVDVVLPRIKDWKGIKGSSGDKSGNLSLGLTPEVVGTWPEIEINYDS